MSAGLRARLAARPSMRTRGLIEGPAAVAPTVELHAAQAADGTRNRRTHEGRPRVRRYARARIGGRTMTQATTVIFLGQFRPESFIEFVRHRADRLMLRAGVKIARTDRIEVSVAGEEDLVDAFEIACSLGPIDCLVLDYRRAPESCRVMPQAAVLEDGGGIWRP
jgi:acylphosphatase